MITIKTYKTIDFERYHLCLKASAQYVFQAERAYLEATNGTQWEFLVYGDYQAVMPIPIKKKFGWIKMVVLPPYLQQLGVFSPQDDASTNRLFYDFLIKHYLVYYYAFNAKNQLSELPHYKNYRLSSAPYAQVLKGYSVHRRRNVRPHDKKNQHLSFAKGSKASHYRNFFMNYAKGVERPQLKAMYFSVLEALEAAGKLEIYEMRHHQTLVSVVFLMKSEYCQSLIGFINNYELSTNASSYMIDCLLKNSIDHLDFNFNGSNVPSVSDFYHRFGAQLENYPVIPPSKVRVLKSLFRWN
ncbi:hypothetical protein [Riemerella columbina]|uniref:hypothetical protein n=1 Tax=Riemerella columbina TaxID=103810 RepID=UPI0026702D6B|nr:hypothetical protein [Riemerella columbina]WKS94498.1 hypothetical protein NYR17_06030 [Riemerella columbina]